jgi:hypothetical protein
MTTRDMLGLYIPNIKISQLQDARRGCRQVKYVAHVSNVSTFILSYYRTVPVEIGQRRIRHSVGRCGDRVGVRGIRVGVRDVRIYDVEADDDM